jgi:hypothetical protein
LGSVGASAPAPIVAKPFCSSMITSPQRRASSGIGAMATGSSFRKRSAKSAFPDCIGHSPPAG